MTIVDSWDAGWYPDPHDSTQLRWWDGNEWTDQVSPLDTRNLMLNPKKRGNPVGVIGFSLAVVGVVLAWSPPTVVFGWILLLPAFILGVVGTALPSRVKGFSITALALSVIGIIIGIATFVALISNSVASRGLPDSRLQNTLEVPAGFEDTNMGVAIKWIDNPDCGYSTCVQLEAFALRSCPNSLYVEGNILDASGRIVSYSNDRIGSIRAGETAVLTMRGFHDNGKEIELTDISCH